MDPLSYTPISNDGMSVFTAIILIFSAIIIIMYAKYLCEKNKSQDSILKIHGEQLSEHADKMHSIDMKLTSMEGDITTTKTIVERIDGSMTELGKTNQYLIKHILEK